MTKVVNIKYNAYDVYIGRANLHYRLPASIWQNPYHIGRDGTREEVIAKYEELMRRLLSLESEYWLPKLLALKGHTLGCWCKPEACHGDVLVKLIEEYD